MQYIKFNELMCELDQLTENTDKMIPLIYKLVDDSLAILGKNDRILSGIDTYNKAICILKEVLKTNESLRETIITIEKIYNQENCSNVFNSSPDNNVGFK